MDTSDNGNDTGFDVCSYLNLPESPTRSQSPCQLPPPSVVQLPPSLPPSPAPVASEEEVLIANTFPNFRISEGRGDDVGPMNEGRIQVEITEETLFQQLEPGQLDCTRCGFLIKALNSNESLNMRFEVLRSPGTFHHAKIEVDHLGDRGQSVKKELFYVDFDVPANTPIATVVAPPPLQPSEPISSGQPPTPKFTAAPFNIGRIILGIKRKRTASTGPSELADYLYLPMAEAAQRLQLCFTALGRVCRRIRISRWPKRKSPPSPAALVVSEEDVLNPDTSPNFELLSPLSMAFEGQVDDVGPMNEGNQAQITDDTLFQRLEPGQLDCSRCSFLIKESHSNESVDKRFEVHCGLGRSHHAILEVDHLGDRVQSASEKFFILVFGVPANTAIAIVVAPPPLQSPEPISSAQSLEPIFTVATQMNGAPYVKIEHATQRKRTANMGLRELAEYFHLSREEAAQRLQISLTALQRVCRRIGISRWPSRKINAIDGKIKQLLQGLMEGTRRGELLQIKEELEQLLEQRARLYEGHNPSEGAEQWRNNGLD